MVEIEDLLVCPEDGFYGGISQYIYYAKGSDFERFEFPQEGRFGVRREVVNIGLKPGKALRKIGVFLEGNGLREKAEGGVGKMRIKSELKFSVLGLTADSLGFVSGLKNEGLVFFVPDNNGKNWIFGTPKNSAFLTNYEGDTGEKTEDDPMVFFSFVAHTELYFLGGGWVLKK